MKRVKIVHSELLDKCKKHKRIFLYGAGNYGKRAKLYLEQNGVEVSAFLQTDATSGEKSFRSTPIYGISDVEISDDDLVIVCVGKAYQEEILSVLASKQVRNIEIMDRTLYEQILENISFDKYRDVPNGKYIQVLLFHRVIEKENDPWGLEVSPQLFEQYMAYIADHYNVARFEDDWSGIKEKTIVVTFDDGYWDNYRFVLPILEKYHVPATVFVSTANLGTGREFWWDRLARLVSNEELVTIRNRLRQMAPAERDAALDEIEKRAVTYSEAIETDRALNRAELKKLAESEYITIGGHTVNHNALMFQSRDEQKHEIEASKRIIEEIIGKEITTFSYPFGQRDTYSDETIEILSECGFKKAATTVQELVGKDVNSFEVPRIGQPEVPLKEFVKKLEEKWYIEGDRW
jgi:peptidoglycan/xylan/chitin deacetylase (PgdA/CDA1 family)